MFAFLLTVARMYLQLQDELEGGPVPKTAKVAIPKGMSYIDVAEAIMVIQMNFDSGSTNLKHEVLHLSDGKGADFISVGRTLASKVKVS